MKKLFLGQFLFGMLIFLFLFSSCNKNSGISLQDTLSSAQKIDYLKLQTPKKLNDLVDYVAKMSDDEYSKWKSASGLKSTLYDRFIEAESKILASNATSVPVADSSFFYISNDQLRSKNGILLDKVLNDAGIIQVGEFILKYENGKVFFITEKELANKTVERSVNRNSRDIVFTNAPLLALAPDHQVAPTSASQQSFNFTLFNHRDQSTTGKLRHWTILNENYLIVPVSVSGSYITWSVTYRLYLEFTQQKRNLFVWNTFPESTVGHYIFWGTFPDLNYYPGWITNEAGNNRTLGYGNYTPSLGPIDNLLTFHTSNGGHPTWTIYQSDATQNITTEGYLGSSLTLKTTQMHFALRWEQFGWTTFHWIPEYKTY